jgi:transcriptional regulator with XRE-family HTH domain
MSTETGPVDDGVGARLKDLRRKRGLSAREVADAAQVSPAYLSRLEHGKVSPTVATLSRIVHAMGESIGRLFGDERGGPLVRRADRRVVANRGVTDAILTPVAATRLEVLETTIEPGASSGTKPYHHPGDEECVVVLAGRLTIWLDGEQHTLDHGDALTFPCRTPHRWQNPTDLPTTALWIITPAGY